MFYKGQYKPSYLLCPEKYTFQPFSESVLKLNENKYSILDTETDSLNSSEDKPEVKKTITFVGYNLAHANNFDLTGYHPVPKTYYVLQFVFQHETIR